MYIQIIHGHYDSKYAIEIITQMINTKIKLLENKITTNWTTEEDIKLSESKIKRLQNELFEMRTYIQGKGEQISIHSSIEIQ